MIDFKSELNEAQYEAVQHVKGPLLVFAGAGSGKTRVITYRIANLILNHNIPPYKILAVTFTNKAADEMKERVKKILNYKDNLPVWLSTFHSFGLKMLRYYGKDINIDSGFTVFDEKDQINLIKKIIARFNYDTNIYKPESVKAKINFLKNSLIDYNDFGKTINSVYDNAVYEIYKEYQKKLSFQNCLDFADLIFFAVKLFNSDTEIAEKIKRKFDFILIDEFQDTNKAQYKLIRLLTKFHSNLCVVGDDDQSIYSWRGARVDNIIDFQDDFKGTKVVKLVKNYRSTKNILEISNRIISSSKKRIEKILETDNETGEEPVILQLENEYRESDFVINRIQELIRGDYKLNDIAVFYRVNAQSRVLEEKFLEHNIPYVLIGTLNFYERMEIKDVLSYLKFIVNTRDNLSLERLINVPKRGIGKTTLEKLNSYASEKSISLYEAIKEIDNIENIVTGTKKTIKGLYSFLERFIEKSKHLPVNELLVELIKGTGYIDYLEKDEFKGSTRIENVSELINSANNFMSTYKGENPAFDYLEKITLVSETDKIDNKSERVSLMTLHCAKGLEFPVVFITGVEEGMLPHINSFGDREKIDEERRLCYVGVTRAKKLLYLTHTFRRWLFGDYRYPKISRFLNNVKQETISSTRIPGDSEEKKSKRKISSLSSIPGKSEGRKKGTNKKDDKLNPGMQVIHKVLGPGKIINISGDQSKAEIYFVKSGLKKISLRHTNITVL